MSKPALLCCSAFSAVAAGDDGAPSNIVQLIPMGTSKPRNGKPASITLEDLNHAQQVVDATASYHSGADVVIDFDHQTVRAPAVAGTAPAAGWMKRIYASDQGIMAEVEWTEEASAMLRDRKYRNISPYFAHTADGRVTRIINAGLTNTPNLDLLAVASAISTEEDDTEMLKTIATALGLAATADEAAVLAAITANKAKTDAFEATASALGVELKDGEYAAVASAATALKDAKPSDPDPAKFVPIATVNEMQSEMSAIQKRLDAADMAERVSMLDAAQGDGRLSPAMRKHFEANIKDKVALASALGDLTPGLVKVDLGKKPEVDKEKLTDEEKSIASMMGIAPADYLKTRNAELETL